MQVFFLTLQVHDFTVIACEISGRYGIVSKKQTYQGKLYPSLKKLVEQHATNGNNYPLVAARMKEGWELDEALSKPKNRNITRSIEYRGITYKNLRVLSEALGISYNTTVKRVHRGWTIDELFNGKTRAESKAVVVKEKSAVGIPIEVGGVTYGNMRLAYEALQPSCKFNTLKKRLYEGWPPDEAFELVERTDGRVKRAKRIEVAGESYSLDAAAVKFGVSITTIANRLKRGASVEQAVGLKEIARGELTPVNRLVRKPRTKKTFCVDGVNYNSVTDLATAFRLPYYLVYNRMSINKWDAERSVKEKISEPVMVNGIEYRSALNAFDKIGKTTLSTFHSRRMNGFSLEVCLGLEPLPVIDRYELNGKVYSTLSEVAADHQLSLSTLMSRLAIMSMEEAVVYKPTYGRYTAVGFERDPELANTAGTLYFVKVHLAEGTLHKVGITKRAAQYRFVSYDIEVISEIEGRMVDLFTIEQRVLEAFSELRYRAQEDFDGRTETFQLQDDEQDQMLLFIQNNAEALL